MQQALARPFLHVSSDHLAAGGMLPVRRDPIGEGRARTGVPAVRRESGIGRWPRVRRDLRYPLASRWPAL